MQEKLKLRFRKNYFLIIFSLLIIISFTAINIGTALFGSSYSADLTSKRQYTLSPDSIKLLNDNQQNLFIRLYISPNLDEEYPDLALYSQYVIRLLEQYKNHSEHKLNLEIIEPRPYEQSEIEAKKQGLKAFLDKSGQNNLYFGAVISNDKGDSYTVPYFEPRRQNYLEHDISRILSKFQVEKQQTIGIISPVLDVINKEKTFDTARDWSFIKQLRQDYKVEYIAADTVQIPLRINTLIVINPINLSQLGIYALDQYLMRGGRIIMFLDPFSEAFLNTNGYINSAPSNLTGFLENMGVEYNEKKIAGDIANSQNTLINNDNDNSQIQNYPLWMDLSAGNINSQNILTAGLGKLRLNSSGFFNTESVLSADITPLFATSEEGGEVDADVTKYSTKATVKDAYETTNKCYNLGVMLEGKFPSAFTRHPLTGTEYEEMMFPFLITSIQPGKLILIGDSDMLYNTNWNLAIGDNSQSPYEYVPYNNNIDFLERAVDYMSESKLLSIAAKRNFNLQSNLGQQIEQKISAQFADEYTLYDLGMRKAQLEQAALQKQISNQEVFPSIAVIKKMENYQREYLSNQEKLKELQYKIQQLNQKQKTQIIILNSVVYPLIIILAVWFISFIFRCHIRRQAERYTHA